MKLSKAAILALRGLTPEQKKELANAVGVSDKTIYRYISDNDDNLTKAAALEYIRKVTGLGDEEILEKEPSEVKEA